MDDSYQRLTAKLVPAMMTQALMTAGAILTGYELVKSSVLDGVRGFFVLGDEPGEDSDFARDVLALVPGNRFRASVEWLIRMDALRRVDAELLETIRLHRGEVTHELGRLLTDPNAEVDKQVLLDLRAVMRRLDVFWGGIVVDTDRVFDGEDVDRQTIRGGGGLLMDYLVELCGTD